MGFWNWMTGATPAGIISESGQKVVTGIFDGVSDLIKTFHLPPEEELKFKMGLAQLQLQTMQAHIADVQSARQMQMTNKSVWPGVLSAIITLGFFGALGGIVRFGLPSLDENGGQAVLILLGTLTAGFSGVLNFWLGSSSGSQVKDHMIWQSTPPNLANSSSASVTTTVSKGLTS